MISRKVIEHLMTNFLNMEKDNLYFFQRWQCRQKNRYFYIQLPKMKSKMLLEICKGLHQRMSLIWTSFHKCFKLSQISLTHKTEDLGRFIKNTTP